MHAVLTGVDVVLGVIWAACGMWQRLSGRSIVEAVAHAHARTGSSGGDAGGTRGRRRYAIQGRWMLGLGAVWLFTAAFRASKDPWAYRLVADGLALGAVALAYVPTPHFHGHGHGGPGSPGTVPPPDGADGPRRPA